MEADSKVVDLMERLRESLGQAGARKRAADTAAKKTRRASAKGRNAKRRKAA